MADLKLDVDDLKKGKSHASSAKTMIAGVSDLSGEIAGAVGHDGLAGQVRDFSDKWSIARDKLSEQLQFVADGLGSIIDSFEDLDRTLASKAKSDDQS